MKDLGLYFDVGLTFKNNIQQMLSSATKSLSFVIRICHNFSKISTFKLLYNAFVRSKLDYGSVVWNKQFSSWSNDVEKVQKRFLRYLYYRSHKVYPNYKNGIIPTTSLQKEFSIISLKDRRVRNDILFLFKLFQNKIDCPQILNSINFRVNAKSTRQKNVFAVLNSQVLKAPILRILSLSELFDIDFNHDSRNNILKKITPP